MDTLASLLSFYQDAGAFDALSDQPIDRFAQSEASKNAALKARNTTKTNPNQPIQPRVSTPQTNAPMPQAASQGSPKAAIPDQAQVALAREQAAKADNLEQLRAIMDAFEGCNLKFTAKSLVFGDGDPNSDLMVIGEAPGRDEDYEGIPFMGRSGQLLERMLAAIKLKREDVYLTQMIAWRPPGNRQPTPHEIEICRPFVERQIALVKPRVIFALGASPAKTLCGTTQGILRIRGSWLDFKTDSGESIAMMTTLQPDYLLRNPAQKSLVWRDLLALKDKLDSLG